MVAEVVGVDAMAKEMDEAAAAAQMGLEVALVQRPPAAERSWLLLGAVLAGRAPQCRLIHSPTPQR